MNGRISFLFRNMYQLTANHGRFLCSYALASIKYAYLLILYVPMRRVPLMVLVENLKFQILQWYLRNIELILTQNL
jgi:hypothetical protein